jgi:hypothetical protein
MKTIKSVFFGAVLFCSASVGFAILPPDASLASVSASLSIYKNDFVWKTIRGARAKQAQLTSQQPGFTAADANHSRVLEQLLAFFPPPTGQGG